MLFTMVFINMIQEASGYSIGYSSAKFGLLLQGFGDSYVNYTQWATLGIVLSLCHMY